MPPLHPSDKLGVPGASSSLPPARNVTENRVGRAEWVGWSLGGLVALATLAVFLPALHHGFLNWDDDENFLWNPHYRGLGWVQLEWMFTSTHLNHYIPITWMTLGLDYVLWGMNPAGYHATSVALHTANAVLVYLLACRLLESGFRNAAPPISVRVGAAVAALLFSIHPLRVESVAWVTERRDVLSGLFALLTVLAYVRACRRGVEGGLQVTWYWASAGLFALALLSKSVVVGLPLILLALDVYPLQRASIARGGIIPALLRHGAIEKGPFFILGAAASILELMVGARRGSMTSLATLGIADRAAITAYELIFYLRKTLVPSALSPLYTLFLPVDPWSGGYLLSGLAVVLLAAAALVLSRRWPGGVVAGIAYLVLLLPVSGVVHNGPQIAADRYTYLATLGWALLAGAGVTWALAAAAVRRISRPTAHAVLVTAGLVVVSLMALSVRQVGVWRDSVTLWRQAAAVEPESDIPIFYLGWALSSQGRLQEARDHFIRSLGRVPDRLPRLKAQFTFHLGIVEDEARNRAEAERRFRETLSLDPDQPAAMIRLAVLLLARGEATEARQLLTRAVPLALRPDRSKVWELRDAIEQIPANERLARGQLAFALGMRLQRQNALDEAQEQYRLAVSLVPEHAGAWNNLGVTYAVRGRHAEALQAFLHALGAAPGYAEACRNGRRAAAVLGVSPSELGGCAAE